MRGRRGRIGLGLALACCGAWPFLAHAAPFPTAFTYQGVLEDAGQAADGLYDIQFTAFADASSATPLGPPVVVEDVQADDGVFVARVDFGGGFFVGDAIWLELAVRPGAQSGAFETLVPRQELTPTPYALKPAANSITDVELADGAVGSLEIQSGAVDSGQLATAAVGSAQLQNDAVGTTQIADASVQAEDLAPGVLNGTFWRLGGNPGAGNFLGTTDGAALRLQSDDGVAVNTVPLNTQTELTLRGTPAPDAANADLALWPRDGTALFSLTAQGASPTDAVLAYYAVGTNPFTGFLFRMLLEWDGDLGIGDATPQGRLHVARTALGLDAGDLPPDLELVLEDSNAEAALYSSAGGSFGSVLALGEIDAGTLTNQWALVRNTTAVGGALNLAYGTDIDATANPVLFRFGSNASLGVGGAPVNAQTEVAVYGSPSAPDSAADLSLQPRGVSALFNWKVAGTTAADTALTLQHTGGAFNYEPRVRFAANGAVGFGRYADADDADAFVFADDSSATPFASTGANQFLVRAVGGVGINRPGAAGDELTIGPTDGDPSSDLVDVVLGSPGSVGRFRISTSVAGAADTIGRLMIRNSNSTFSNSPILEFITEGSVRKLGLFRGRTDGSWVSPAFPLHVGDPAVASSGNGAHLTTGGVWTNGSSRLFKEAFNAVDPERILEHVLALRITRWRYRGSDDGWHLGPVAEDFHAAFGLGDDERYIGTVDADGVALAALQGLHRRTEARAAALEAENASLRDALEGLARRVAALEGRAR
jgi:hypothetical protein